MNYPRLFLFLLSLALTSCVTAPGPHEIPAQVQHGHHSRGARHYNRIHGQSLRHPNCYVERER